MARRGIIVDAQCNAALIYCFAVRGHLQKADSLVQVCLFMQSKCITLFSFDRMRVCHFSITISFQFQQTSVKYGDSALPIAMAACARAAAARADTDRLRHVSSSSLISDSLL